MLLAKRSRNIFIDFCFIENIFYRDTVRARATLNRLKSELWGVDNIAL